MDAALRRTREARHMLDADRRSRHCDGAVTCALLAAECALKATLLFGHGYRYADELPKSIHDQAFKGSSGHNLVNLYQQQPQSVRSVPLPTQAVLRLSLRDRYGHRYGRLSPPRSEASAVIGDAEEVVAWMKGVLT